MTARVEPAADPLAGLLGYCLRESARRAEGKHRGVVQLADDELAALLALLQRELGSERAQEAEAAR